MIIKTFEFWANCFKGNYVDFRFQPQEAQEKIKERVAKPEDVDKTINKYLSRKDIGKVISINENFYVKSHHNNGGQNTVVRSITIITEWTIIYLKN